VKRSQRKTTGWVLSCETGRIPRCRSRCAEEKATSAPAQLACRGGTSRSRRPHARGDVLCTEPGRSHRCLNPGSGRLGKATSCTPSMHVVEKSDGAIVPTKRPNKGRRPPAEAVEGRASTKRNSGQVAAVRTQSRIAASIGMADVGRTWHRYRRLPSAVRPEVGARCVSSARRDLRGAVSNHRPYRDRSCAALQPALCPA
jgi:hypothetical protein